MERTGGPHGTAGVAAHGCADKDGAPRAAGGSGESAPEPSDRKPGGGLRPRTLEKVAEVRGVPGVGGGSPHTGRRGGKRRTWQCGRGDDTGRHRGRVEERRPGWERIKCC